MVTPREPETLTSGAPSPEARSPLSRAIAIRAIVSGLLLVIGFWPVLVSMYGSWFDPGAYMEHGILVIPAAAYMVWSKLDQLKKVPLGPSAWGFGLIVVGASQAALGVLAHWVWISRVAFLVSLVGCIVLVFGWGMVRELVYPLCTLILMIAPPTFAFARLTLSLQLLASRLGQLSLEALGYSVLRDGNVLEMVGIKLSVEEACSGIRSLMAILFLAVLYNYFFVQGKWMRTLILIVSVPIAILGNAARIVATGVAGQYNRSLTVGAAHETFGYVSVAVAALGCMGIHIFMLAAQKVWRSRHV
jgi:exosortase